MELKFIILVLILKLADERMVVAQNLPYGTHIFQFKSITKGNADAFLYMKYLFTNPKCHRFQRML